MISLREQLEAREREVLAPQAAKSADSRGRLRAEPEEDVRPAFQRDCNLKGMATSMICVARPTASGSAKRRAMACRSP